MPLSDGYAQQVMDTRNKDSHIYDQESLALEFRLSQSLHEAGDDDLDSECILEIIALT